MSDDTLGGLLAEDVRAKVVSRYLALSGFLDREAVVRRYALGPDPPIDGLPELPDLRGQLVSTARNFHSSFDRIHGAH